MHCCACVYVHACSCIIVCMGQDELCLMCGYLSSLCLVLLRSLEWQVKGGLLGRQVGGSLATK